MMITFSSKNLMFNQKNKKTTKLYKQNLIVSYSNNFHGKICLGAVADLEIGVRGILTYENFVKLTTESFDLMVEDLQILGADFSSLVQFTLKIRIKNFRKKKFREHTFLPRFDSPWKYG